MFEFREYGHESVSRLYLDPTIPRDRQLPERGTCRLELIYDRILREELSNMEESTVQVEEVYQEVPELLVEDLLSICI